MGDFHLNWTYNKGARSKNEKKVSNFEDRTKNFYSDKTVHFYMGFHTIYSTLVTLNSWYLCHGIKYKKRILPI
jgi:hypothetical protein